MFEKLDCGWQECESIFSGWIKSLNYKLCNWSRKSLSIVGYISPYLKSDLIGFIYWLSSFHSVHSIECWNTIDTRVSQMSREFSDSKRISQKVLYQLCSKKNNQKLIYWNMVRNNLLSRREIREIRENIWNNFGMLDFTSRLLAKKNYLQTEITELTKLTIQK